MRTVRIIGPGRVGRSFERALVQHAAASPLSGGIDKWHVLPLLGRHDDLTEAADGADLVLVTTPDDAIRRTAALIRPNSDAVVAHTSGTHTLDALDGHARRASIHPLASIPDPATGARRLVERCAFALDGDPIVGELVAALDGRPFHVDAEQRVRYHAAATIAANHLVALLGQVERVARTAGVPLDAYLDLAAQTLENVRALGPSAALTGPVARGDWATVARHLAALDPSEQAAYRAMADQAGHLCGRLPALDPADMAHEPSLGDFLPGDDLPYGLPSHDIDVELLLAVTLGPDSEVA